MAKKLLEKITLNPRESYTVTVEDLKKKFTIWAIKHKLIMKIYDDGSYGVELVGCSEDNPGDYHVKTYLIDE